MVISCSLDDDRLAVDEVDGAESGPSDITTLQYTWTPDASLARHLPAGFAIHFTTIEHRGRRRVVPTPPFLQEWALAGDAILRSRGQLTQAGGCYDFMRLIAPLGVHLRERIQPRRFSRADLHCKQFDYGILPDDFEFPSSDAKWSVKSMLDEGRSAAKADEILQPTLQQQIIYGIDAEAQRNPVNVSSLSTDETSRLVRTALFDVAPADGSIEPVLKGEVYSRLTHVVRNKLAVHGTAFNNWFHSNFDNVIHSIAKRKKAAGGTLDQKIVRGTVIELVFDSWNYLAQTIEFFADDLANSLTPRLSSEDRKVFTALYCRSPQLGNLPLCLVVDISIAKPVIGRLLLDPTNDTLWGQLLRVLQTHREMIVRRRTADRVKKREQGQGLVDKREFAPPASATEVFDAIGEELAEERGLKCDCGTRTPSFRTQFDSINLNTGDVGFAYWCTTCEQKLRLTASIERCKQLRARQQEE